MPVAYLNGKFLPLETASISPLDRGFLFGDGIYEVIPVHSGKIFCLHEHLDRLNEGLKNIRLQPIYEHQQWENIFQRLVKENSVADQWIYLQITRGADTVRDHQFPERVKPTVFAVSHPKPRLPKNEQAKGIKAIAITDIRWKHCHIKTIARAAYVLMYQEAKDGGFDEGIIINNGYVLEGTTSNVFIVRHGVIFTPPKSSQILSGITRNKILQLAEKHKIPYRETKIAERELLKADEIWISSSTRGIYPVVEYNGNVVGSGYGGTLWERMWDLYAEEVDNLSVSVSN